MSTRWNTGRVFGEGARPSLEMLKVPLSSVAVCGASLKAVGGASAVVVLIHLPDSTELGILLLDSFLGALGRSRIEIWGAP